MALAGRQAWTRTVLWTEDTPENCTRNYGNAIYVPSYDASNGADEVAATLRCYLAHLQTVEDVRTVEKRGWLRGSWKGAAPAAIGCPDSEECEELPRQS